MPKKSKKMKQRAATRREMLGAAMPAESAMRAVSTEPAAAARSAFSSARATPSLTYDYSYIYKDLRRIAFFAAFFFGVLVALSFVIK